ncbi:hypothetical protein QMA10_05095 [Arthrobacter sp. APC 3897]|uniref:hypothetical protein n=1 Tax=Arthrobacter sp. APC 3897 TaxID=3035204 RepID=UPI0025B3E45F|nr:hypothetical protein [Arthrobacter sp. APC 3897]MDN3481299.1 hypothetical protein [Arthrobacter sp. APC 3897]
MNELPERDDAVIRRLLEESGVDETPELLDGLRKLRSFTGTAAPVPTGELAELLSEPAPDRSKQPRRHRGLILSFTLAAAMAAGASGVAASTITDLRLTSESVTPAEVRDASPVQEDSGQETDEDGQPGPAAPVSPSAAEPVVPEAASPEGTPAVPGSGPDSAPESGAGSGTAAVGAADGNPAIPPAVPAPPANLPGPSASAGSVPDPAAAAAPAARTPASAETGCGHDHGGPGDPGHRGKPDQPGGSGKPDQPGTHGRDRGAGEISRPGVPGRDSGGGAGHGYRGNPGKQPHNPGQKFSEGSLAPGNS